MDAETIQAIATLARKRSSQSKALDGMERLGAQRALRQLADDLEATANEFRKRP